MAATDLLQVLEVAVFLAVAAVAVASWLRRRQDDTAWLAVTFAVLGATVLAGSLLPPPPERGPDSVLATRVVLLALAVFPYCLFRFAGSFSARARHADQVAAAAVLVMIGSTMAIPGLPVPGDAVPWWWTLYVLGFVVTWTVLSVLSVRRLWRAGRGHPAVTRRRMHTLGLAAMALNAGLLVLAASGTDPSTGRVLGSQAIGIASAVLLLVAFAPPRALRAIWRREDLLRLRLAEADLIGAGDAAAVAAIVLPQAAGLAGARTAALVDGSGRVVACHGEGVDGADVAELAGSLPVPTGTETRPVRRPDMVAVAVHRGWIVLGLSARTPFFGLDELAGLEALGHLTGLALDRADLLASDQAARRVLAEREAQLAEAQQTARLGSYSCDLASGETTWSEEMHRLLGFSPGEVTDFTAAFQSRVHPDDREEVFRAWAAAQQSPVPGAGEYRLREPDGSVRWMQWRFRPTLGADGVTPTRLLGTVQDITERKLWEETVAFHAMHDLLTGLPNRSLLLDRLTQALARRTRHSSGLAVLFFDLDRFKWLNDSRGHAAGDELLKGVAARLQAALRPGDTVARFGGDEFVVLCEEVRDEPAAQAMARRISEALAAPVVVAGEDVSVTASVGIAFSPATGTTDTADTLLRDADAAMYQAKERGRDRHEIFSPATRRLAVARHELANSLRRGMDRGELVVRYQPTLDITTNKVVGVEALVRWAHPRRGLLAPAEFIPMAEETGLIVTLGVHVLREACKRVQAWQPEDPAQAPITLAVNLAARQLMAPDLCDVVEESLESSGLDPSLLCLEITESVLLEDVHASSRALQRLKDRGVRIGVDDFGTGFSSLTYLKRFPLDVLKIDRSFVEGLGRDREDRAIVAAVVDLAHAFGLTTVAEGVETPAQLAELRGIGCEQGQGYLWSGALGAGEAREWMAAHASEPVVRRLRVVPDPPAVSGGSRRTRVLIVDDDRAVRALLRVLCETDEGFEVVGEADDGREAIALARHLAPDAVLLDLAMPGMGGLEALPLILAVAPNAKVAVVSALDEVAMADAAIRRGAAAYLVKGTDPAQVLEALKPLVSSA